MPKIATRVSQLTGEGALPVFARAKELEKEGRSIIHLGAGRAGFSCGCARGGCGAGSRRLRTGSLRFDAGASGAARSHRRLFAAHAQAGRRGGAGLSRTGLQDGPGAGNDGVDRARRRSPLSGPELSIYPSFTRGLGARAVSYSLLEKNKFQPDIAEIAAKVTPKTRVLIFNSPNNPTGTVFSDRALVQLAELAKKHDLWVLADEIYARILFAGEYKSIWTLPEMAERTVIIDGFRNPLP